MKTEDYEKLTPFERAFLEEMAKLRGAVQDMAKALDKAVAD